MNLLYSPVKGSTSSDQSPDDPPYQPSEYELRHLCKRNQDRLRQLGFLSPSGCLTGFGSSHTASPKQGVPAANDAGSSNPPVSLEHEQVGGAVDGRSGVGQARGRGRGRSRSRSFNNESAACWTFSW